MAPKKKQEKMSLGTFLGDQSLGSWADEMDEMPMPSTEARTGYGSERREYSRPSFGGDRGDRDFGGERSYASREQLPLPTKPPFTAHLGNLSFDVTQGDINDFFNGCSVTSVRIVEDKLDRKPKGFGYVEFGTLDGLKKALDLNGTQFQGRNVRISVAEPPKERAEARELNDWSRKGPLPELPGAQRRPSDRNFERAGSDFGGERNLSRRGSAFGGEGDGRTRDLGNWERKGPLTPLATASPGRAEGGDMRRNERSFERRGSPASWGEGREPGSFQAARPPRGERPIAPERTPTAAEMDNQWRSKMRPDAPTPVATPTPDASTPSSPAAAAPPAPAVRPRLNLQKRTVSEAPTGDAAATPSSDSKASPFGAARPIDTRERDRQLEEKRLALRQKKEEEEKVLAEKRAAEKADKAEKQAKEPRDAREPREKVTSPNGTRQAKPAQGGPEDLDASSKPRNFEILRRMEETGDSAADDVTEGNVNGDSAPEVIQVGSAEEAAAAAHPEVNGDDWETVGSNKKNSRRGGRGGTRA